MFPAQALSDVLTAQGWSCAMITDARGQKHTGQIKADPVIEVKAASISPRRPIKAIGGAIQLFKGVKQAKTFMRDWKPDVVIGFGGYPSFPALKAAEALCIPRLIHEQNAVLGRVNRVFAKKAQVVASGFGNLARLPDGARHVVVGNPLRTQILEAAANKSDRAPDQPINILTVGGSLGANILSERVPAAIAALPDDLRANLRVTQQATESRIEQARASYAAAGVEAVLATFFSDIEAHLQSADLIIARAGASSVSEIALMGKPSILIPLAIAMDDHQTENAMALERLDAAKILPESDFTVARLTTLLTEILNDTDWLDRAGENASKLARPDAAKDLAALVVSSVGK
jgi:UDP-N-acetylglucosamine--N-acetylmuramyl-(pentapeptide) pyrophosphoryl-undecaprenol N-acetylglucosamine transferase